MKSYRPYRGQLILKDSCFDRNWGPRNFRQFTMYCKLQFIQGFKVCCDNLSRLLDARVITETTPTLYDAGNCFKYSHSRRQTAVLIICYYISADVTDLFLLFTSHETSHTNNVEHLYYTLEGRVTFNPKEHSAFPGARNLSSDKDFSCLLWNTGSEGL